MNPDNQGRSTEGRLSNPLLKWGRKRPPRKAATNGQGSEESYFTFCVLNNALHQDRVLGYALSDQKDTLLHAKPPHDGEVANFL